MCLNTSESYALLQGMKFVEQTYPSFVWGTGISVRVYGDELEVSGIAAVTDEERRVAPDPFRGYLQAVTRYGGQKRQGKNSPHIQFANAETDQELVRFVQRFGPVVVSSLRTEERDSPSSVDLPGLGKIEFPGTRTVLVARQDLAELRSERRAYRAALSLVGELQWGKRADVSKIQECVSAILESVSQWPAQWEREHKLRASGQGCPRQPPWLFRQDNLRHLEEYKYFACRERTDDVLREAITMAPLAAAHHSICELVNAFEVLVYPWGNIPVEAPDWDLTGGIRPLLYYILRREYLLKARSVDICRNTDCRHLFEIERFGQTFCGEDCSRLQRQREYWEKRGKHLRQSRFKRRKSLDRH